MPRFERPVCGMFFWDDFRVDPVVSLMSSTSVGIYMRLLCSAWNQHPPATLPTDQKSLIKLSESSEDEFAKSWSEIQPCFIEIDGRFVQKRLQITYENALSSMIHNRDRQAKWYKAHKKDKKFTNGKLTVSKRLVRRYSSGSGSGSGSGITSNSKDTTNSTKNEERKVSTKLNGGSGGRKNRGTEQEIIDFCLSLGLPESDGIWCFNHWMGNGWMNGKNPIADWKATVRTWTIKKYLPSLEASGSGNLFKGNTAQSKIDRNLASMEIANQRYAEKIKQKEEKKNGD